LGSKPGASVIRFPSTGLSNRLFFVLGALVLVGRRTDLCIRLCVHFGLSARLPRKPISSDVRRCWPSSTSFQTDRQQREENQVPHARACQHANIPTEELRDFVADHEKTPKKVLYSLDPQLVWKGKGGKPQREASGVAECGRQSQNSSVHRPNRRVMAGAIVAPLASGHRQVNGKVRCVSVCFC